MTRIKELKESTGLAIKAHPLKSAVVIARLLKTEGFTDYTANGVERYWKHSAGLNTRQQRQIVSLEQDITRITKDISAADRLALGRFIGLHKKMSFDVGLKIGLQTFAQKNTRNFVEELTNGAAQKKSALKQSAALQEAAQAATTEDETGQEVGR